MVVIGATEANLVFADWRIGAKLSVQPGDHVDWADIEIIPGSTVTAHIMTGVEPAQLDIHYFRALTPGTGIPGDEGTVEDCRATAGASCHYVVTKADIQLTFRPPVGVEAVLLNGRWYIPAQKRPPGEPAVEGASWGFRLQPAG
jgi:hypothetical protein